MARERDYDEDLGQTKRVSPYRDLPGQEDEPAVDYDGYDEQGGYQDADQAEAYGEYEEYGQNEYADEYDEEYADEYDGEDTDREYEEEYGDEQEDGGFFSTLPGKIVTGVIALLIVALVALLVVRFLSRPADLQSGNVSTSLPSAAEETKAPGSIVFAPVTKPTEIPTPVPTAEPTDVPKPTDTPLPIIMTNTPTPSPTPTVTPTPSPTPTPAPTATPEPTKVPEIGAGEVNRDAKLRSGASSSAGVKSTIKKGERVTIHDTVLDESSKVWYALTVDDLATTGWMRDYVVDTDEKIAKPTHTPKPTATPDPDAEDEVDDEPEAKATPEPTKAPAEDVIGIGRTNKEANVRKVMNGKVIVQLRKNKKVEILNVKTDKNGKLWYEVRPEGSSTVGYVRDYLIDLEDDVKFEIPTATPKPQATPDEKEEPAADTEQEDKKEESILDREIIGRAKTKKPSNVRVKPVAGAKLIRQLSKGIELMVLDKYKSENKSGEEEIWYEVCTESGKTHGFVRDYLLDFSEFDQDYEAKTYGEAE